MAHGHFPFRCLSVIFCEASGCTTTVPTTIYQDSKRRVSIRVGAQFVRCVSRYQRAHVVHGERCILEYFQARVLN